VHHGASGQVAGQAREETESGKCETDQQGLEEPVGSLGGDVLQDCFPPVIDEPRDHTGLEDRRGELARAEDEGHLEVRGVVPQLLEDGDLCLEGVRGATEPRLDSLEFRPRGEIVGGALDARGRYGLLPSEHEHARVRLIGRDQHSLDHVGTLLTDVDTQSLDRQDGGDQIPVHSDRTVRLLGDLRFDRQPSCIGRGITPLHERLHENLASLELTEIARPPRPDRLFQDGLCR
jgi:hypothetical protein